MDNGTVKQLVGDLIKTQQDLDYEKSKKPRNSKKIIQLEIAFADLNSKLAEIQAEDFDRPSNKKNKNKRK